MTKNVSIKGGVKLHGVRLENTKQLKYGGGPSGPKIFFSLHLHNKTIR